MAFYPNGCLIGTNSQPNTSGQDFNLASVATRAGTTSGSFLVDTKLQLVQNGDVASITTCGNIDIFDDENDSVLTVTDAGPNTTGTPHTLLSSSPQIAAASGNTGNTWKVVYHNLVVVGKDGVTYTVPTLTKTFPSPF